jgi:hypothetical protein
MPVWGPEIGFVLAKDPAAKVFHSMRQENYFLRGEKFWPLATKKGFFRCMKICPAAGKAQFSM